jgi:hypothetical protein
MIAQGPARSSYSITTNQAPLSFGSKPLQYGWFVEPGYRYAFSRGHDQSLAVNIGLLVALPPR